MRFRPLALSLLLIGNVAAQPQSPKLPAMRTFVEQDFGMTFIYPAELVPVDPRATALTSYAMPKSRPPNPPCVQSPLSVGSNSAGNAALVFSLIDDACPGILRDAQKLADFVHAQLLRQLRSYGVPTITQDARLYTFDSRPAVVILGSATPVAGKVQGAPAITYAAKVCMFANVPAYNSGKIPRYLTAANSILCFDFTAHQAGLLPPLLYLPIVFGEAGPRSMVPAALLPPALLR